jgi:2-methylcitrate dehydratase
MDNSTEAFAEYAHGLQITDIPAEARHHAKCKLIDTLGCAMGGYSTELSRITRAMAGASTGAPGARVLGSLASTTPEMAAFANGTMIHALDFNDVYMSKSTCHPSDALSGILATAEAERASGESLLLASVLSYEASCGLADVIPREQGIDNTFYCMVGGAVGSAKLMGVSLAQMQHAMSLAVVSGVALEQTRTGALSMWKNAAGPNAARNAVFVAQAARAGITGPDAPIEGKWGLWNILGHKFHWEPFGGGTVPFRIAEANLKRFPAVAHAQSPITAALQLRDGLRVDDIESIAIESYWVAKRFEDPASPLWKPSTHEQAGSSLPYLVAVALTDGDVSEESFSPERLNDPQLTGLVKRTVVRENPAFNTLYPEEWPCRIELTLRTGEKKVAETRYFKGHNKSPLSQSEVEAKFRQLASPVLGDFAITSILERLWTLEEVENIHDLVQMFDIRERN